MNIHCFNKASVFHMVYHFCYDKEFYQKNHESTTTEDSMFGNFFDEPTKNEQPYEPFTTVSGLINGTSLKISEMLNEYVVGNSFSVTKNVNSREITHENLENDWKMTIDHQRGVCYTLDPSLINFSLVPQTYYKVPQGFQLTSFYLNLDVSSDSKSKI